MNAAELHRFAALVNDLIVNNTPVHVIWRSPAAGPLRTAAAGLFAHFGLTGSEAQGPLTVGDHFLLLSAIREIRDGDGALLWPFIA